MKVRQEPKMVSRYVNRQKEQRQEKTRKRGRQKEGSGRSVETMFMETVNGRRMTQIRTESKKLERQLPGILNMWSAGLRAEII